jgi:predicted negative regulator of RcsB-dependent stress response
MAMKSMESLLELGQTQYRERVLDVYARMSFDEEEYEKSAGAYLELYNTAHDLKQRQYASEGYMDASLHYLEGAKLMQAADQVLKMEYATEWATRKAMLAKADVLRENSSMTEAIGLYKKLAENTMTVEGAEAYYRLVENDYINGDYAAAESRVYALDKCASEYWHARIFIVLGDVLVKTNNLFQARATYQSVVDGYSVSNDGVISLAKQRIASIGK